MNLSEIRERDRNVIPRFKNPNLPEDDPYNVLLQADMDRRWLLEKIDELTNDVDLFSDQIWSRFRG